MKIAFLASKDKAAQAARVKLERRYGKTRLAQAEVIAALGGDGFMLQTLHAYIDKHYTDKPIYGINMGTIGFLMNSQSAIGNLRERIEAAQTTVLHPLSMTAWTRGRAPRAPRPRKLLAINEVSLFRQSSQTARFRIIVDGRARMDELYADGILLATAAGSTAYNLSAGGPIIPIGAEVLALTPISAFRPRRWRGGLLSASAHVRFEVIEAAKRPVSAVADHDQIRDITRVDVAEDRSIKLPILFDRDHSLEERIISEQFQP